MRPFHLPLATLHRSAFSTAVLLLGVAAVPALAELPTRELLFSQDTQLPSPKVRANVIRVKLPPGVKTPPHSHEGPGPRYVIAGKVKVEDAGRSQIFGPGEVFWETIDPMSIENIGPGDAELIIFEMAPQKQ